jgi:hypothetical protein
MFLKMNYCITISIDYVFQPYQIIDGGSYMVTTTYLLLANKYKKRNLAWG